MNFVIVMEGRRTEPKVLRGWLGEVFPEFTESEQPEQLTDENYYLIEGRGQPAVKKRVAEAVKILKGLGEDATLFVFVDSEEDGCEERRLEYEQLIIECGGSQTDFYVIVQHRCIETWLLGNRKMIRAQPRTPALIEFKSFYDVRKEDPELLPNRPPHRTHAQTHEAYLKAVFKERDWTYAKRRPGKAAEGHYFRALEERCREKAGHLPSFRRLVEVWESLGGDCEASS